MMKNKKQPEQRQWHAVISHQSPEEEIHKVTQIVQIQLMAVSGGPVHKMWENEIEIIFELYSRSLQAKSK